MQFTLVSARHFVLCRLVSGGHASLTLCRPMFVVVIRVNVPSTLPISLTVHLHHYPYPVVGSIFGLSTLSPTFHPILDTIAS